MSTNAQSCTKLECHTWLVEHLKDLQHVIQHPYDPAFPAIGVVTLSTQFQEVIVTGALLESTLTEALAYATFWICAASRRATFQEVIQGSQSYMIHISQCRELMASVRDAWIRGQRPLTDFQPCFLPPPPAHGE